LLVAIISDTHMPRGSRRLPEDCTARLLGADLILHAGDVSSAAFFEELALLGPPVLGVHGNADEPALREALPERRVEAAGGIRIGMVHDGGRRQGREDRLLGWFPGCHVIVYGHTHAPQVERRNSVWILNPGSPTERRRSPARTMIELVVGHRSTPRLVPLP
jgi:putative phosphoesterase